MFEALGLLRGNNLFQSDIVVDGLICFASNNSLLFISMSVCRLSICTDRLSAQCKCYLDAFVDGN